MYVGRNKWLAEETAEQRSARARKDTYKRKTRQLPSRVLPDPEVGKEKRSAGRRAEPRRFTGEILRPLGLPETCREGHILARRAGPWQVANRWHLQIPANHSAVRWRRVTGDKPIIAYCCIAAFRVQLFRVEVLLGTGCEDYDGSLRMGQLVGAPWIAVKAETSERVSHRGCPVTRHLRAAKVLRH